MKISLNWLSTFVTFTTTDPEHIARALTAAVGEVDDVEVQGELLQNCCIGKILSVMAHPNADKLRLCDVATDRGTKRVVCGGTNLREGMSIAFAHIGATVRWHGGELQTIAPVKIRGESSEGMICAAEELGLQEMFPPKKEDGERPIVEFGILNAEFGIGTPLREALGLTDVVFHIDNHAITHRADLFSHRGFARECVAIGIARWKKVSKSPALKFAHTPVPFKLHIEKKSMMPRYCACVLSIDGLGETPEWMKRKLQSVGWRSVNLPVDITNYVATEVGVPLHSFDVDDLSGDVSMRCAHQGEKITTLDGQERDLPEGALVLSDDKGIFDLLGIMGGLRSSTKATTRRIYLHSASLDPVAIRSTVIATGHRTDAATVYEKGVSHDTAEQGFLRALELFLELVPGAKIISKYSSVGDSGKAPSIPFSVERARNLLGAPVTEKDIRTILLDLGCSVKKGKRKGEIMVTPPLWRLKDLRGPHDLIEEVGRVYGFDRIPVTPPEGSIVPPAREERIHALRDAFAEEGFVELLPLSLLGPDLLKKCSMDPSSCVRIENPIGEDASLLAPCVVPRLLEQAQSNLLHVQDALRTFHCSAIFAADGSQTQALGALLASRKETTTTNDPFLLLKRSVFHALRAAGYAPTIAKPSSIPSLAHPGRSASVCIEGTRVGMLFEVLPSIRTQFDLPERASVFTLNLDALLRIPARVAAAEKVPLYPAITYDITCTLDPSRALHEILARIRSSSLLLKDVRIVDVYSGNPLSKTQYNVTVRCTYRSDDRTLTEEEVKKEHGKVEVAIGS